MDDFTDRTQFRIGDLLVIPARLIVVRDGKEIKFEPRWMGVLVMLAEHAGETLNTERLLIDVWGSAVYGDSPVNKAISCIRNNIGDDRRNPRYIETVSKAGYRVIAPVSLPENYRRAPSERWAEGSPYVGLSAFDADHASVFCGRSRIVADLLRAMRVQIENQRRFVLIVGASGCGKTSLLRAGAIPLLTKPDGFDGLRALAVATCDLAASGGDPLIPLTAALATWTLDDRPVFPPLTLEQLKALLTETPEMIEGFVSEAFRRHSERNMAEQPYAHLLLSIDHAEALVATTEIDTHARDAFARVVQALCDCPHVMVTMIARGDFYLKLIEALPVLAEYKAGDGHLDVMTPRYGEIGEIIRSPAWKADLSFDTDPVTRTRLDDALRDAALSQPDALPLLQHTLQTLYERRNDQRQLTFAAYNDIGGLEGAVAHRAEEVFAALPVHAQASLDAVLAKIIIIQPDNDAVSARGTSIDAFDADARTLIDAFTAARLFVRDHHNGQSTLSVVHEALLRRWPRAVEWTQDNRRLLQAKARLKRAAARWVEEGRQNDHLLNPGRPLAEALEAAGRFAEDIGGDEHEFLRDSEKIRRHKRRLKSAAISLLTALTLASFALASITIQSRDEAEEQRDSLVRQAFAFRSVGEMVFNSASIKGAESAFLIVNENLRVAHENNPKSEEILAEYGVWSYWLGYFYDQNGQFKRAEPHWERYLDISRELTESSPHDLAWKMELSYALNNIGNIRKKELHLEAALRYFLASERIKREVIASVPENDNLIYDHIDTLSWIGSTQESLGDLRSASANYVKLIEMNRKIVSLNSSNNLYRRKLGNELWRSARLSSAMGERKKSLEIIDESISHLRDLTLREPASEQFKRDLSNVLLESAMIANDAGENELAVSQIQLAKAEIEKINMRPDARPSWLRLRATIRLNFAAISKYSGHNRDIDEAVIDLHTLANQHPDDPQFEVDLANARIIRGKIHAASGNLEKAIKDWKEAKAGLNRKKNKFRDHIIIGPWIRTCLLLGQRDEARPEMDFLLRNGYVQEAISDGRM